MKYLNNHRKLLSGQGLLRLSRFYNGQLRRNRIITRAVRSFHGNGRLYAVREGPLSVAEIFNRIPIEDTRNFCFIAHVDHGKSSLASRVLEYSGNFSLTSETYFLPQTSQTIEKIPCDTHENYEAKEDFLKLDTLSVEQQRGITVKASAASMLYKPNDQALLSPQNDTGYLMLNMVDTPGHIDFGLEVTRSLHVVEGAVLLFDAAQGVQAQTLNVFQKAVDIGTELVPALTKVDLPHARPLEVSIAISEMFGFDPDKILLTSARQTIGVESILEAVACNVPPPVSFEDDDGVTLRAQVLDSWFEQTRGVVCLLKILSGNMEEGDRLVVVDESFYDKHLSKERQVSNENQFSLQEVGMVLPHRVRTGKLLSGQMGYAIVGLRDPRQARPGSLVLSQDSIDSAFYMEKPKWMLDGDVSQQSALFASVHPLEAGEFDDLCSAVDKLSLNDTGLEVHRTSGASGTDGGPFLGPGLRIGFQGLLHVEVFRQRLLDEFNMEAVVTPPKVSYLIKYLPSKMSSRKQDEPIEEIIEDLSRWPKSGERSDIYEPIVKVRVISPVDYAGNVMELIKKKRGYDMSTEVIDDLNWIFHAQIPWGEVVTSFHDELKNCTAGYASFDTQDAGYRKADLCRVEIMLNGDSVDPLTFVSHRTNAQKESRVVCKKLKETLPREQFVIKIQAKADGKIIASEHIKAYRKDVLTTGGSKAVGGGDITRKKKLLEKQKRGKKRLAQHSSGKVRLSQAAFNSVVSRSG